jgi:hypothetical protein
MLPIYIPATQTTITSAKTRYVHPTTGEVYGGTDYDSATKLSEIGAYPLAQQDPSPGYMAEGWEIIQDGDGYLRRPTSEVVDPATIRTTAQALADLDARVDARSQELLANGFVFADLTFDILQDQERWKELMLAATAGLIAYPVTVYAQDKQSTTLADLNAVKAFVGAYMQARETVLAAGRATKASARALETAAEIDALEDPR